MQKDNLLKKESTQHSSEIHNTLFALILKRMLQTLMFIKIMYGAIKTVQWISTMGKESALHAADWDLINGTPQFPKPIHRSESSVQPRISPQESGIGLRGKRNHASLRSWVQLGLTKPPQRGRSCENLVKTQFRIQ